MKYLCILTILLSGYFSGTSQITIFEEIRDLQSSTIGISTSFFNVEATTWDNDYIEISGSLTVSPKKRLKKWDLELQNTPSKVSIKTILKLKKKVFSSMNQTIMGDLKIKIPEGMELDLDTEFGNVVVNGNFESYDLDAEFGNMTVSLDHGYRNDSSFDVEFGDLDVSIHPDASISFLIDKDFSDIRTDLPLKARSQGDRWRYRLNGGDNKMDIDAEFGNIYLRSL